MITMMPKTPLMGLTPKTWMAKSLLLLSLITTTAEERTVIQRTATTATSQDTSQGTAPSQKEIVDLPTEEAETLTASTATNPVTLLRTALSPERRVEEWTEEMVAEDVQGLR